MENKKPENPNAFPYGYGTDVYERSESGMTLRDYFAAKAMDSLIIKRELPRYSSMEDHFNSTAAYAYSVADSMLKERSKTL